MKQKIGADGEPVTLLGKPIVEAASVTHCAGPFAMVPTMLNGQHVSRGVQRCAICGELLIDTFHMADDAPIGFGEGHYVRKLLVSMTDLGPELDRQPDDFCISRLDPPRSANQKAEPAVSTWDDFSGAASASPLTEKIDSRPSIP